MSGNRDEDREREPDRNEPPQEAGNENAVGKGGEGDQQEIEEYGPEQIEDDRPGRSRARIAEVDRSSPPCPTKANASSMATGSLGLLQGEQQAAGEQRGAGQQPGKKPSPDPQVALSQSAGDATIVSRRCVSTGAFGRRAVAAVTSTVGPGCAVEAFGEARDSKVGRDRLSVDRDHLCEIGTAGSPARRACRRRSFPSVVTSKSTPCRSMVGWTGIARAEGVEGADDDGQQPRGQRGGSRARAASASNRSGRHASALAACRSARYERHPTRSPDSQLSGAMVSGLNGGLTGWL